MTRMTDDPNPNPKNNSKNKSGELTDKYPASLKSSQNQVRNCIGYFVQFFLSQYKHWRGWCRVYWSLCCTAAVVPAAAAAAAGLDADG